MKARRVCAQCGKVERRVLGFVPKMFKIWKGTSHDVDLCSFECSGVYYAAQRRERSELRLADQNVRSLWAELSRMDEAERANRPACKASEPADLAFPLTVAERTAIRDALSVLIPLLDDDTELPPCPGCGDTSDGYFACCEAL